MDENGEANQQQPQASIGTQGAPENPLPAQPATQQQLRETEQKIEEQIEERMTGFERSMVRLTRYGLAVTILTAIVFAGQLYEMISGGTQTDKLVSYAKVQANAASDQGDAAQQFSDTTEDINSRMQEAVDQLQAAADNAKISIDATRNALRLEQRPWVFISGMELQPPTLNDPIVVEYSMKNEGRTPATMLKDSKVSMTVSLSPVNQLKETVGNIPFKTGLVFPGVVYGPTLFSSATMTGSPPHFVGASEVAAYNAKPPTLWVYVYGRIVYADAFGIKHTTSYCEVSNGTHTFEGCIDGTYPTYAN